MKRLMGLAILMLSGVLHQEATAQHTAFSQSGAAEIDRFLGETVQRGRIPAVEAIVVDKEDVLFHGAYRQRNAGKNNDLKKGDLFDIASMTKPITSVAVMMLYEDGKLDLDDPVSMSVPSFKDLEVIESINEADASYTTKPPQNPVLIRHLLSHTSGMGYPSMNEPLYRLAERWGETGFSYDYMRFPLLHEPGGGWSYGISARVSGALVEKLTGQSLDEFFASRIFAPLGMHDTFYEIPEDRLDRRVSVHTNQDGVWVAQPVPQEQEPMVIGDAALISTAGDYANFLQMLLNGGTLRGTRILNETSVEMMTRNQIGKLVVREVLNGFPAGAGRDKFGLGFQIATSVPEAGYSRPAGSYSWAGSYNTFFWVDPDRELAAVLLMQYSPFYDETAQMVYQGFERRVYENLR